MFSDHSEEHDQTMTIVLATAAVGSMAVLVASASEYRQALLKQHRAHKQPLSVEHQATANSDSNGSEDAVDRVVSELRASTAQLVDVREAHECEKGALSGAVLYPLSAICTGEALPHELRRDRTTYLHCSDGRRTHLAAELLRKRLGADAKSVVPLASGFNELVLYSRTAAGSRADAALLRPVMPPAKATRATASRNLRSFDPETFSLFRALQTSRDFAEYEQARPARTPGPALMRTACRRGAS